VDLREFAIPAAIGVGPRRQRQRERGDLAAPLVDLQSVEVVPQHGLDRIGCGQAFLGLPHRREAAQRRDQEVARPAARVEHAQLGCGRRPAVERARGRPPLPLGRKGHTARVDANRG
jgi:hypothetical protein